MNEETFVRELERHADHVHGAPLSFDDVRGRARSIQRRRRATAAAAVAAAVAVVAAVPAVLSGSLDRAAGPDPAPPVPVPSAHTAVLHDQVVDLPDGRAVHLDPPPDEIMQLGFLTDGRVLTVTNGGRDLRVISTTGSAESKYPVLYNLFTVSADDRLVAWLDPSGQVQVLEAGHADPVQMAEVPTTYGAPPTIDAVTGSDCANGGCTVLVADGASTFAATTSDGYENLRTKREFRVNDISPDGRLWAVHLMPDADHELGCAGLYDPEADTLVARSCTADNLQFAPDGQHLLSAFGENNVMVDPAVLDLHLKTVTDLSPAARSTVVSRMAWVDPTHVLVGTADVRTRDWVLERIDLSGHEEVLAGQSPGPDPERGPAYVFSD